VGKRKLGSAKRKKHNKAWTLVERSHHHEVGVTQLVLDRLALEKHRALLPLLRLLDDGEFLDDTLRERRVSGVCKQTRVV